MRREQEEYIRKLFHEIEDAEEKLRDKPMPELTRKDFFLFHQTGNRLVYENAYFGRRRYLTVYAVLSLWGGELSQRGVLAGGEEAAKTKTAQYAARLGEVIQDICAEEFWALPAHVDFDRIKEPDTRLTIDLFAAETAQALSEISLRLYDRLPETVVSRAVAEVCRRVLVPFVSSPAPYAWWETDRSNWAAVCAGCVGMAALNVDKLLKRGEGAPSLAVELPADWKEQCLARVRATLMCYLDGMEADGACTEGLGYYNYGMSFYTAFEEAYARDGGRPLWLDKRYAGKFEQIALFQQKCYFGGGVSISFSDGSACEPFLPGLTAYLGHLYPGQVRTPDYSLARPFDGDACYRYLTNERNIRWLVRYGEEASAVQERTAAPAAYLLPSAQWLVCQDKDGNGFAAKGGHNGENHNHNDVGHFLCVYNGEMLLADLGAGEYTKDYFGDKRYEVLCCRSLGHCVPIINGGEQCAGEGYRADRFAWEDGTNTLTVSFAGAYREGAIAGLTRTMRMKERTGGEDGMLLELTDQFDTNRCTQSIAENLVTAFRPTLEDGEIVIKGRRGECRIRIEGGGAPQILSCTHMDHAGKAQTVYRVTWELPLAQTPKIVCGMWISCRGR